MSYGCHNLPRPVAGAVTHLAQAGWRVDGRPLSREPVMVPIHHVMTTTCQFDKSTTDPSCAGCHHIKQGTV